MASHNSSFHHWVLLSHFVINIKYGTRTEGFSDTFVYFFVSYLFTMHLKHLEAEQHIISCGFWLCLRASRSAPSWPSTSALASHRGMEFHHLSQLAHHLAHGRSEKSSSTSSTGSFQWHLCITTASSNTSVPSTSSSKSLITKVPLNLHSHRLLQLRLAKLHLQDR